jgi:periplasmic protein TonB
LAPEKRKEIKDMFDQLVESTSARDSGSAKRNALLVSSLALVAFIFSGGLLWSLFAKDFNMSGDDLTLSSLVAPVPVPESEPPKPDPVKPEEKKQQTETKDTNVSVRPELINRMDDSPKVPDKPSTTKNPVREMAKGMNIQGPKDSDASSGAPGPDREGNGGDSNNPPPREVKTPKPPVKDDDEEKPPPPTKPSPPKTPTPTPTPPKITGPVSGGVVNGKATSLPKPPYPAAAKAVRASGTVSVQVLIDENGNVVSASATSGHPLLRSAAEQAARSAKFSPTMLSGQKVKVSGIITYNFVAQ